MAEAAGAGVSPTRVASRILGRIVVILALLSALVTFVILSNFTPILPTHNVVVTLFIVDVLFGLALVAIIVWQLWPIVQARRRGRAAARLHVRIIALFSLVAAAPAILVAVVATVTLDRGLDRLISSRTEAILENSFALGEIYLRDQAQDLRQQAIGLAKEISRAKPLFDRDRERFRQQLGEQAADRGFAAMQIIDRDRNVVEKAANTNDLPLLLPSQQTLAALDENEPQIHLALKPGYFAAAIKLPSYDNLFLFLARPLDRTAIARIEQTQENIGLFSDFQSRRSGVQLGFALAYALIGLIATLSAVWIGLNFANYLVAPIRRLIGAANLVSTGNLFVQVPIRRSEGDLAHLGETFNKMTQELRTQRDDIVRARDLIDSRRRFTEAVLAGASAGIIGVDAEGRVSILNRSAEKLIGHAQAEIMGQPLLQVVPELSEMLAAARSGAQRLVQGQVTISRNGRERNLSVRVASEQEADAEYGYVITLDDITELVSAQRTSAWADVARRIAHEIKNPLTPIQLSAERLRRKYGKVIGDDREVFEQCTDTIVRQVEDIKRMVDEFSRFARMPKPVMAQDDVADAVRQAVFLMRVGHSDIDIDLDIAEDKLPAHFDRRLISQALTNIIKNAAEAISAVPAAKRVRGKIRVSAAQDEDDIVIDIVDNGVGLPKENRNRLLEPYVTTREKGTGLGLAIVSRILEEHGGGIELKDAAEKIPGQRGAWVRLRFARNEVGAPAAPAEAPMSEVTGGR
ncbi:MAG: PAS domain-containing sensor histidine kinase [Xanthobacteraceae bacterium]